METTVPLVIAGVSLVLLALGALLDDRRARARRLAVGKIELPLLHSINDDRCIGCEACVDVCPTEVLELDSSHKARVVRFSDCVQCEQCANACPTTALVMYREGSKPQTLTVPELDDRFMTGVPGQYLIGEVAGKPLVKNAANLGRAVIEYIARDLAAMPPAEAGVLDVAIVGSGPGGLSAGLTCLAKKLSCVVIEKEHAMASTVARYPKGKLFMAEPSDSGNLSYLPVFDATKEDLVATWKKVAEGAKLPLKLGEAVDTVKRGDDGLFTIKSTVATYRARTVVLATGLRGKPRLLAVPGANLEKVQSRLEDPDVFGGQHVLVVGGGDSAVEAAMSLADAGATVTLSYRGDGFKRCKAGNQKRLAELTAVGTVSVAAAGTISVLLESNVKEFTADAVSIKLKSGELVTIPNQQAFVLIGADTPVAWLEANNVRFVEREHLYALGSTQDAVRKIAPDAVECSKVPDEALAIVLGKPRASKPAVRPAVRTERSVVSRIRHEVSRAVGELTGVFKLADLEQPKPPRTGRAQTHSGRNTPHPRLVTADRLVRPPPPPKLFAHHDDDRPFTPVTTTVEMMSLPARLKTQTSRAPRPSIPRPVPRASSRQAAARLGFDTEPTVAKLGFDTEPTVAIASDYQAAFADSVTSQDRTTVGRATDTVLSLGGAAPARTTDTVMALGGATTGRGTDSVTSLGVAAELADSVVDRTSVDLRAVPSASRQRTGPSRPPPTPPRKRNDGPVDAGKRTPK